MQYTKIPPSVQKHLSELLSRYPLVQLIAADIQHAGGKVLLVGGAVRDLLLGLNVKDLDIEVHQVPIDVLEKILKKHGPVSSVGKAFGVLRLHGLDVDWSVPRKDMAGRKPTVMIDPFMQFQQAFGRRDLTINAMGIDLHSFELIDPFGGQQDLHNKILRAPDPIFFIEDPLRFFRVMQFVARFDMQPDDQLNKLCATMDVSKVSRERIEQECAKWLLKSSKPSAALDWLAKIGRLKDIFPEIAALGGIKQEPKWHPEGDVYEHVKQTIDAAAALEYGSDAEKLAVMYAALCHDLGKVSTTEILDGEIKSYGHAQESARLAAQLLKRITGNKNVIATVKKLVKYHMHPPQLVDGGAKLSAYKRLANKLAPEVTLNMLAKVVRADHRGRNRQKGKPLTTAVPVVDEFLKRAQQAKVRKQVEPPILQGRDLMDVVKPGPQMGKLVKAAYQLQLEEGISDKQELKRRVLDTHKS